MTTTYIDPSTDLPQNLSEIYSDRNLRIVGRVRINPTNSTQLDLVDVQVLCTPTIGGVEVATSIPNGTYFIPNVGDSLWLKISRSTNTTTSPVLYAATSQPKSRRDYIQLFYRTSEYILTYGNYALEVGYLYTRFGFSTGQRVYDAIVGDATDSFSTHSDLQTAITDVPNNSCILVKKMCLVTTTINTSSKTIKFVFNGKATGLQANGATIGITFQATHCQLVGYGTISGFTTGVNLNNHVGARLEMIFSSNTTNINLGSLTGDQYSINGSFGLSEVSHTTIGATEGTVNYWNNTLKRWHPSTTVFVYSSGEILRALGTLINTANVIRIGTSASGSSTNIWFTDSSGSGASSFIRGTSSGVSALQFATGGTGTATIGVNPATIRFVIGTTDIIAYLALKLINGSAALPALSFESDADTGIYRSAEDTLQLVTGGANRLTITNAGFNFNAHNVSNIATLSLTTLSATAVNTTNVSATGVVYLANGSAALPSLSFTSDTNTGVFRSAEDVLALVAGGTARLLISNSAITPTVHIRSIDGTLAAPGISFTNETGTGMLRSAVNTLVLATAGAARITITNTAVTIDTLAVTTINATTINTVNHNVNGPLYANTFVFGTSGYTGEHTINGSVLLLGGHSNSIFKIRYNDVATQRTQLSLWASEPGVTYKGGGIGVNIANTSGWTRWEATQGASTIRFFENTIEVHGITAAGVRSTYGTISSTGWNLPTTLTANTVIGAVYQ